MAVCAAVLYKLLYALLHINIIALLVSIAAAAALYAVLLLAMRVLTRGEIEQMPAGEKLYALITKMGFYR